MNKVEHFVLYAGGDTKVSAITIRNMKRYVPDVTLLSYDTYNTYMTPMPAITISFFKYKSMICTNDMYKYARQ